MTHTPNPEELLNPQACDVTPWTPLNDSSEPDDSTGPKTGYPLPGEEEESK
jgi:hypothetical protein